MKKFTLSTILFLALLFCAFASPPELSLSEDLFPSVNSVYQLSLPFSQGSLVSLKQTNTVLSTRPLPVRLCVFIGNASELRPANPSEYKIHALSLDDSVSSLSKEGYTINLTVAYDNPSFYPHTVASFFISLSAEALAKGFSYGILYLFY